MVKKKVCKRCKMFFEGSECPGCKSNQFTTVWQGRINVINPEKSDVGKEMTIEKEGEYAIKCRWF